MNRFWIVPFTVVCAAALAAEEFDGSKPLACTPQRGHDCLPTEASCKELKAEPGKDLTLKFDLASKTVRTPYRYDQLPIATTTNNKRSLIMQGTSLEYAWNATVHRTTGRFTFVVADREGAYVIFGQCKTDQPKSP